MKISKQAQRDARELLRSCRVEGRLDQGRARQVVEAVLAAKPRSYLAVLTHFGRLVRLELERHSARVESAVPLAAEQKSALQGLLEARYGGGLSVSFSVDPALIGGVKVKVGSDVLDGTVLGRLEALAGSLEAE